MSERPTAPTLRQTLSRVHRSLVLFAVLLVSTTMLISEALMIRDYVSRNLQLVARTVCYTVEPANVFGDTEAVREGLASVTGGTRRCASSSRQRRPTRRKPRGKSREHWLSWTPKPRRS